MTDDEQTAVERIAKQAEDAGLPLLAGEIRRWLLPPFPEPNGLPCPLCGSELLDTFPDRVKMGNPPQRATHCKRCPYRSTRVADRG